MIEALILILVTSQISRLLGPEGFGKYNYVLAIVLFLEPFKKMGTFSVLQSELTRDKKNKLVLNQLLFVRLIFSALIILISTIIFNFYLNKETLLLVFIFQIVQLSRITDIYSYTFYIFKKGNQFGIIQIINGLKLLFIIFISIINNFNLYNLSLVLILNYTLDNVVIFYFFKRNELFYLISKFQLSLTKFKYYIKCGLPLVLGNLFLFASSKLDIICIKSILDDYSAGIYAVPSRIVFQSIQILILIPLNFIPKLPTKFGEFNKHLDEFYKNTWIISMSFTILFFLSAGMIIDVLFGPEFVDSKKITFIIGMTIFFNGIMVSDNGFLNFYGFRKIIFLKSLTSLLLNIILNFTLIPAYGIYGAALALLISSFFVAYGGILFENKLTNHYKKLFFPFLKSDLLKLD